MHNLKHITNSLKCCGFLLAVSVLCYSCKEDPLPVEPEEQGVNGWIHSSMKSKYLWLDEIKEYGQYDATLSPEDFFEKLISNQEKKNSSDGSVYWYSYIEPKQSTSRIQNINGYSYGMEYRLYYSSVANVYHARVLYVIPGSSAHKAGIRRGMWILQVDGQSLTASNYTRLTSGSGASLSIYEADYPTGGSGVESQRTIQISAATPLNDSPILKDTLYNYSGVNVGYLCYTHFSTGPDGFKDKTWDSDLISLFTSFRSKGIDELILDLRYNPGGYVTCAQLLASLIAPEHALGKTFCALTYHESRKKENYSLPFDKSYQGKANINLSRVYVLTTSLTASASEAVINGLRASGIMEVIQIGSLTEGKNLGSQEINSDKQEWILHPIVAKIVNNDGFGEYEDGFQPDENNTHNELRSGTLLKPLGDPNDPLIKRALLLMGLVAPVTQATRSSEINELLEPLDLKPDLPFRISGMRLDPQ